MKIGFACKYHHPDQTLPKKQLSEIEQSYNGRSTTAKWLTENPSQAYDRLWSICVDNVAATHKLVNYVAGLPEPLRMLRLGSSIFPLYTHKDHKQFYKETDILEYLTPALESIGILARENNIKMSMHPGQFCVLASHRPEVVDASIEEFEYHADIIRMMGYGKKKLDFKCNVHLSGKAGAAQFRSTYKKLSKVARNSITLENDEYSAGLNDLLPLQDLVGIVLDIHHYWINTGNYISSSDPRLTQIEDSWCGQKPTIHYSYSRADYIDIVGKYPDLDTLVDQGIPRSKLRAHSDTYPNNFVNSYALEFLPRFDIMCEAKWKNKAAHTLYLQALKTNIL